jgi:hypothetical protein
MSHSIPLWCPSGGLKPLAPRRALVVVLVFVMPGLKFLTVTASNFKLQVPSIHDACSSLAHKEFTSLRVVYLTVVGT